MPLILGHRARDQPYAAPMLGSVSPQVPFCPLTLWRRAVAPELPQTLQPCPNGADDLPEDIHSHNSMALPLLAQSQPRSGGCTLGFPTLGSKGPGASLEGRVKMGGLLSTLQASSFSLELTRRSQSRQPISQFPLSSPWTQGSKQLTDSWPHKSLDALFFQMGERARSSRGYLVIDLLMLLQARGPRQKTAP